MGKIYSDSEIEKLLGKIAQPEFMAQHDKSDGWFSRYNGGLADPANAQKYLRGLRNTLRLGNGGHLSGKSVLDIGSGFGLACSIMKMLGADRVEGVDTFQPMIDTSISYMDALPELEQITIQNGLSYQLPYEDNSFDLVLCFEALSHFMNQEQSVAEAVRVLKPGGTYIVADDNNGANPGIVQANKEIWDRFENGPAGEIHGHTVKLPYVESRANIIQEAFPSLDSAKCQELSRLTSYMKKDEIIAATQKFVESGSMPDSTFQEDICPVEPLVGQLMENLINPMSLAETLNRLGCDTDVVAYFGGDGKGGAVKLINSALNLCMPLNFIIQKSPGFKVYGTRR